MNQESAAKNLSKLKFKLQSTLERKAELEDSRPRMPVQSWAEIDWKIKKAKKDAEELELQIAQAADNVERAKAQSESKMSSKKEALKYKMAVVTQKIEFHKLQLESYQKLFDSL